MSFDIYIPCNCYKEGTLNFPPFKDKLIFEDGVWCLDPDKETPELEALYDGWTFCEHNQQYLTISMAQSILSWKKHLESNYPNQFPNLFDFFPNENCYVNTNYNKQIALKELEEFILLMDEQYHSRLNQFKRLLETAISLEQEIYWA